MQLMDKLKKKIRVIPIKKGKDTKVFYGMKPDKVTYVKGTRREELEVTLAIDTEERDYGGYPVLIPLSALEGVI